MKRIYSFLFAAVALFAAASCQKEIAGNDVPAAKGEPFTITAVADAQTKTALNADDDKKVNWTAGDAIAVFDATGDGVEFTTGITEPAAQAVFEAEDFTAPESFVALYPYQANLILAEGVVSGLELKAAQTAKAADFDKTAAFTFAKGENKDDLKFNNLYSLLKFTVVEEGINEVKVAATSGSLAGKVTLNVENGTLAVVEGEGASSITLAGEFQKDGVYYICVLPGTYEGFSIALNGYTSKTKTSAVELAANHIYDLGNIALPVPNYGLVGSFQTPTTWDVANPVTTKYVSGGWIVAKNVELYKSDEFKFAKDNSWNVSYGTSAVTVLEENVETTVVTAGSQNMKVSKNGKYDVYLNPEDLKVKVVCVEEYTDLTVDITIDNRANWSPLYINLWKGEELIADNAEVTDNKYTISGDYICETLTYQLGNGSKSTEVQSLSITKQGASIILDETIVKLKVQLTTANAKQWWGNTMKIHVWNSGTSFDTTWPGHTMTSEGNYTWSIIIPSDLIGKTINYKVHNGNGWESNNSTLNVSAEGHTIDATSLGVN